MTDVRSCSGVVSSGDESADQLVPMSHVGDSTQFFRLQEMSLLLGHGICVSSGQPENCRRFSGCYCTSVLVCAERGAGFVTEG